MSLSKEELVEYLKKKTKEKWDNSKEPYYLSMVQPELSKEGKDYRAAIGDQTLSAFSNSVKELDLVRHPKYYAKIGLVPAGSDFTFDKEIDTPNSTNRKQDNSQGFSKKNVAVVSDFLILMSKLDDSDLEGFNIPSKVLAKMLKS